MSIWCLLPFFALLCVSSSTSHLSLLPDHTFDFTLYDRLLLKFSDFHLVVHFDNTTKDIVNSFLLLNAPPSTTFNYDSTNAVIRADKVPCLHVVYFDNPMRFSQYLNYANVLAEDVVLFLTGQTRFQRLSAQFQKMLNLEKAGRVLVMVYGSQIEIYKVSFYNGKDSGVHLLDRLNHDEFPEVTEQYYPKTFRDFNGHVLRVAYVDYFPFVYCRRKNATVCEDAIGSEYEFLKILSSVLHFNFVLMELQNATHNSVIESLAREEYDFGIGGIWMNKQRREVVPFSTLLKFEDVAIIYKQESPNLPTLFDGFTAEFPFLVVLTFMVTSMVIFWIIRYHRGTISLPKIFIVLFCISCEQPCRLSTIVNHGTFSIRLVWLAWALFWTVLNNSMRSELTSMIFEQPKLDETLTSFLKEGRLLVRYNEMTPTFLEALTEEQKRILTKSKILIIPKFCERVLHVATSRDMLIGHVSKHLYHSRFHCAHVFSPKDRLFHHLAAGKYHVKPLAWPFKKGASFVGAFNQQIERAINGGLLTVLRNSALFKAGMKMKRKYRSQRSSTVNFKSFSLHLMTLGVLLMGCFGCFLGELVHYHLSKA